MEENKNSKIIASFDISTTTIGCSIMLVENNVRKVIKVTSITPKISSKIKGTESLFLKKRIFEEEFLKFQVKQK